MVFLTLAWLCSIYNALSHKYKVIQCRALQCYLMQSSTLHKSALYCSSCISILHSSQFFIVSVSLVREYMFLLGGNFMPGTEKLWGELLFPKEKMVVFSTEGRKNNFFRGKQMFFSEFFWPRHNVFSLKDTFSSYFILWPPISLYFLMGSVSYCPHEFCWSPGR